METYNIQSAPTRRKLLPTLAFIFAAYWREYIVLK